MNIRKQAWLTLFASLLLCISTTHSLLAADNGGIGVPGDDPPLPVNVNWFSSGIAPPAFYWNPGPDAPNIEGPFTFSSPLPTRLDVTDDFLKGDRFEVFDFGISLGLTSLVPVADGGEVGPDAAFIDPTYSSGSFLLGPGDHSITLVTVINPYTGGRGYLRVFEVPEPSTAALGLLGAAGLLAIYRRSTRGLRRSRGSR